MGLEPGDAIAMLLPNSVEVFELYLAVGQAGFYLIPINWHLVGPEIAYIVQDCEAKVFVAHARFAEHATGRGRRDRLPRGGPLRRRRRHRPASAPTSELKAGQPTDAPADRQHGHGDELHVGHDRAPEGRAARAARTSTPRPAAASASAGCSTMFGLQPFDDNVHIVGSPLYHTAVLVFAGAAHAHRPHGRGDGQVDAASRCCTSSTSTA